MNDHEAIDTINQIFDAYCDGDMREVVALMRIGRALGLNAPSHAAKKGASDDPGGFILDSCGCCPR